MIYLSPSFETDFRAACENIVQVSQQHAIGAVVC